MDACDIEPTLNTREAAVRVRAFVSVKAGEPVALPARERLLIRDAR